MAIIKTKVIFDRARLESSLKKRINDAIQDPALLDELGRTTVERIKFEARREKPLNESRSLPDLKDSSKRIRKNLAQFNNTPSFFDADRSNVTLTGQLLDSLKYKVIQSRAAFQVFFSGNRKPYQNENGVIKLESDSKTNEQVAKKLFDRGFVIFDKQGLGDETFQKRLTNIVRKFIRKNLR